jgi:hypothetical protein
MGDGRRPRDCEDQASLGRQTYALIDEDQGQKASLTPSARASKLDSSFRNVNGEETRAGRVNSVCAVFRALARSKSSALTFMISSLFDPKSQRSREGTIP